MTDTPDLLCTVKEACFSEKCGRTTIYKRVNAGVYVAVKIGGSTRLIVASLLAYRRRIEPRCLARTNVDECPKHGSGQPGATSKELPTGAAAIGSMSLSRDNTPGRPNE